MAAWPSCQVTHELQGEEVLLTCTAQANPEDVVFYWSKEDVTFSGQGEDLESSVRLRVVNETAGQYFCHVNNTVGEGICNLELTDEMMISGLSEQEIFLIIIVVVVVVVIILISLMAYFFHRWFITREPAPHGSDKPRPNSEVISKDPGDMPYENLPFQGLKTPPKKVLNPVSSDFLDYADADYAALYAEGPISYKKASEAQATLKRQGAKDWAGPRL